MKTALLLTALLPAVAAAQPPIRLMVRVPATSNPYLAGMPEGTRARVGDLAPAQSPVLVEVSLSDANAVSFTATGAADHTPNCPPECSTPAGSFVTVHQGGSEHGISGIQAPMNALVGVFLDDQRPDRSKPPRELDFGRRRSAFLSPQLKQVFLIGAEAERILVPKGATRLFLGVMDGYEWNNNTGSFSVVVTVERRDVSSGMFSVDSKVSFAKWACLPDRSQCTPEREIVEELAPGQFHVILPSHVEWGASIPNPASAAAIVSHAAGTVCLDTQSRSTGSCIGPQGSGTRAGPDFPAPDRDVGALVTKTAGGRTYFSVNDRSGAFPHHQGYFEFDVSIR